MRKIRRFDSLGLSLIAGMGAISDNDSMSLCRFSQRHQPRPIVRCLSMAGVDGHCTHRAAYVLYRIGALQNDGAVAG